MSIIPQPGPQLTKHSALEMPCPLDQHSCCVHAHPTHPKSILLQGGSAMCWVAPCWSPVCANSLVAQRACPEQGVSILLPSEH